MGKLVELGELGLTPSWYFSDAYYSTDGRRYVYKWPSPDFPYCITIHSSDIQDHNKRKIEIRRWVERCLTETVIYSVIDKSYRVYYGKKRDWDSSHERTNKWYAFYFEDKHSATMFRLAFSDLVKDITDLHPDGTDEYEKTSYYKED